MEPMARMRSPVWWHVVALLLLAIGFGPRHARAAFCPGPIPVQSQPQTVNFGTITVPANTPVGGVIATRVSGPSFSSNRFCTGYNQLSITKRVVLFTTPNTSTSLPKVYNTNVPGVGIQINDYPNSATESSTNGWQFDSSTYIVALIKTGPVSPGTLTTGIAAQFVAANTVAHQLSITGGTIVPPPPTTCDIATNNLTIQMGNWDADELDKTIATPLSAPQNIVLNCPAPANISMTFAGTLVPGIATPNIFALTPGARTAANVGVQFFINNNPNSAVRTDMSYPINGPQGTVTVPVQSRYFKVGTPTPGKADALVTATFSFN